MTKPTKADIKDPCASCGATTDLVHGERFLSVENEWRIQTLCKTCIAQLPAGSYRWDP